MSIYNTTISVGNNTYSVETKFYSRLKCHKMHKAAVALLILNTNVVRSFLILSSQIILVT